MSLFSIQVHHAIERCLQANLTLEDTASALQNLGVPSTFTRLGEPRSLSPSVSGRPEGQMVLPAA